MKMRLYNTVIELDNIACAQKYNNQVVHIYFVNREKRLTVYCGGAETGMARYPGSADELLTTIETLGKTAEELEHIAAIISKSNG